jgi:hypothetical protein
MSLFTQIYIHTAKIAPIHVVNAYHRFKKIEQPDQWLDFPIYFIHVPKTAGTSICAAFGMPDAGHLLFEEMRRETATHLASKPCFIVVRDPLDRLISTYTYAQEARGSGRRNLVGFIGSFPTVEDFLTEVLENRKLQTHYFIRSANTFYQSAASFGANIDILRFEDINTSFPEYLKSFGLSYYPLPFKKVSKNRLSRRDEVSSEITQRVLDLFSEDDNLRRRAWKV